MDSNSMLFFLQKLSLSMDVTALLAGAPVANPSSMPTTTLGLESVIQSLVIKAAGEIVTSIPNYPQYAAQNLATQTVGQQNLAFNLSGNGSNNAFQQSTMSICSHPLVGFFEPTLGQNPLHVWSLPNQAIELEITLADPSTVVLAAGLCNEIQVSNIRVGVAAVSPPADMQVSALNALANGQSLFYDFVRPTQVKAACLGSTTNRFLFHMSGVRSLIGFTACFVDDTKAGTQTVDKALQFSNQTLSTWQIQLGSGLTIPRGLAGFTHSSTDRQTFLVSQLALNDYMNIGNVTQFDFADYTTKKFTFGYAFEDRSEGSQAALAFTGTDGLFRINTTHTTAPPSTVRLSLTYYENVTLAISSGGVAVI
ncbi:hypothetical protein HKX48_008273 [Thoreauomyces humboldtii]|nr:hypothetical protein HKX48_008273 [Thoreauomyces humboldtii]